MTSTSESSVPSPVDPAGSQAEKLKRHFAGRVTSQARVVLDAWQKLEENQWNGETWVQELAQASEKLAKFAQRFDMEGHREIGDALVNLAQQYQGVKDDHLCQKCAEQIQALRDLTQRKSDAEASDQPRTYLRTPVYVALNDGEAAEKITKQMEFFGFRGANFDSPEALIAGTAKSKPETIIINVGFGGVPQGGIDVIETLQSQHETPIPVIFVSEDDNGIQTRLRAARAGGEEFFEHSIDPGQLIEKIEQYTHGNAQEPYRVLVVDDSRAQAKYIENALAKAGMIPYVITDPMDILHALESFSPEIIIMDMYMPGCTGTELATVIRQQDHLVSVPIIYLSAEDDINKQLHAMSLGGDDFLTKPINPKHLIATIHNRGRRARSLLALMIRDSLTGLYNHTHTLHLLEVEVARAHKQGSPLCFAMLDIDFFKQINDTYGHPIGDRVIKSLSLYLKQRLRKSDHIGRYGGEEFAVILPNTRPSDAKQILNDIRERFSELRQPAGSNEFQVTFSCGLVAFGGEHPQTLSEMADKALYDAKGSGRNCVRSYRAELEVQPSP